MKNNMERYFYILNIAIEAVFLNRVRSALTALGIIFGVAAVIAMMAIGKGAQKEIIDQIKMVGVNNIIITPQVDMESVQENKANGKAGAKYSPGLTLKDAQSIMEFVPHISQISPEVVYETHIVQNGIRKAAKLIGVTSDFFSVFNLDLRKGSFFSSVQEEKGLPVCVIGPNVASQFFKGENPIGKYIKCGEVWLQVIGVMERKGISSEATENLGITNTDQNIYAPLHTVLMRFDDRAAVTKGSLSSEDDETFVFYGGMATIGGGDQGTGQMPNYNQLDKIVVQVDDSKHLKAVQELISRMLKRRHIDQQDFEIKVPELLLKQEQRTQEIFQIVLVAIASISLIVGGIGIMNIMLASVMERIREIGIRRATGATRLDIILQFLLEATLISISGGLLGIILGITMAEVISKTTDIETIISPISILVSFTVSAGVGILFGFMPARRAAQQDPVESLRYQ
ncbi:MAG: ABC transporter permease [Bacteroidales bacterium]|nr:ABC transporter permease [Bacteroidales bacterium]